MSVEEERRVFYSREKSSGGRALGRLLRLTRPEKEKDYLIGCNYARRLDDLVDESMDRLMVRSVLEENVGLLEGLLSGKAKTPFEFASIVYLHQRYGDGLVRNFLELFGAYQMDNESITEGRLMTREQLRKRNLGAFLTPLKLVSQICFDRDLENSEGFEELVMSWADYDIIDDIREDMYSGLILFHKEELDERGLVVRHGEALPEGFLEFLRDKKDRNIRELVERSGRVRETNIPFFEREALRLYFLSRAIKLSINKIDLPASDVYRKAQTPTLVLAAA